MIASILVALMTALVTIGFPPCTQNYWEIEIEYSDGVIVYDTATDDRYAFEERPFRDWRARRRLFGEQEWDEWSDWYPAKPFPGDVDGDCAVGTIDFSILRMNFGRTCPE